jgi:DNA-binding response OmpR family regulator
LDLDHLNVVISLPALVTTYNTGPRSFFLHHAHFPSFSNPTHAQGFVYAEAVDGQDAIHKFTSFRPHLILMDLNMPIKDGFTAAAEIRQLEMDNNWKECFIVAVTALSGENHKRRGMLECGINDWRTKPVGMGSLREDLKVWARGLDLGDVEGEA